MNQKSQPKRSKVGIVLAGALLLVLTVVIIGIIAGSGEGWKVGREDATYDGKPVELTPGEIRMVSPSAVKDSTRVYFNGTLIEWADPSTFEHLGSTFYCDRNGLYREKVKYFGTNTIVPVEGDYDVETFRAVGIGHSFYKDKNDIYQVNFNLLSDKTPLQKIKLDGVDVATFESVDNSHVWYRDARSIYFADWVKLKACPEIDPETFEIVSAKVMKDKNNVYYITRGLRSEGEKATERDDYAILKDAHAPTFTMIDINTYEDKDNVWTISND